MNNSNYQQFLNVFTADDLSHHAFLKFRLIPDLKESGSTATAEDFKKCVRMVERILGRELTESDWI